MTTEKDFYRSLGEAPVLPPYLYDGIRREIRWRAPRLRTFLALAATLVIAAGTAGYLRVSQAAGRAVPAEVADELQSVHDYCNGIDLSRELAEYAYYEAQE